MVKVTTPFEPEFVPCDAPPPRTNVQESPTGWFPGRSWTAEARDAYKRHALMKPNPNRREEPK